MTGPTLDEILAYPESNEVRRALEAKGIGCGYDAFCERLEDAILAAVFHFEKMKPQFAEFGEDALTGVLSLGLQMKGYNADHDNYRNGHCDLVVKDGRYEWYGEAKWDDGPGYILEGFRQLCDRYAPAGPTSCRGGLIIYTSKPNKLSVLDAWIKRILEAFEIDVVFSPVCKDTLTSRSEHVHQASGIEFKVRHIPISFYHNPTDKSARARRTA